jgi:hypothetical protein
VGGAFSLEAGIRRLGGIFALDATILLIQEEVTLLETTTSVVGGAVQHFGSGSNAFVKHLVYIVYIRLKFYIVIIL